MTEIIDGIGEYGVGLDGYRLKDICIGIKDFNKYSFHFIECLYWLILMVGQRNIIAAMYKNKIQHWKAALYENPTTFTIVCLALHDWWSHYITVAALDFLGHQGAKCISEGQNSKFTDNAEGVASEGRSQCSPPPMERNLTKKQLCT